MSKYGVFSGPYFPVFGPEKTPYLDTFHAVIVIGKFSFYYFYDYNISKKIIWHLLSNLLYFTQVLLLKLVIFVPLLFHLKKDRLNTYSLTNTITFVKYLKSLEVQQIK